MTEYKLGTLTTYVVFTDILDWAESRGDSISVRELINVVSGDTDPNVWALKPKIHSIYCRMTTADKNTMQSIYGDHETKTMWKDGVAQYDLYITNLRCRYRRKRDELKPWKVDIEFVEIPLPTFKIWIEVIPTSGTAPLTVNCDVYVWGGTSPFIYDWDWGDNTNHGTTKIASHTYYDGGTYTITCKVTDAGSNELTKTQDISVISQSDIYRTTNIYYTLDKNSVGERPPAMTTNITHTLTKNSVASRPDPYSLSGLSESIVKATRDHITYSMSGLVKSLVTSTRDSLAYSLSTFTESFDTMEWIFDDGGVAFWTLVAGTESDDAVNQKSGSDCYQVDLSSQTLDMYHDYGSNEDMSDKDNIYIYFYGGNSGANVRIEFWNEVYASKTNGYYYAITDNFTGWKVFIIARTDFTNIGTPTGWTNIRCIRLLGSTTVTEIYRVDWFARTNTD